jgi:midasin (ATPase involved in ribosome maturation)
LRSGKAVIKKVSPTAISAAQAHDDEDGGGGLSFLALNPVELREEMDAQLYEVLDDNDFNVGEDLDGVENDKYYKLISLMTGVKRKPAECKKLLGGSYSLTGDNLLKMLAVMLRVNCGIPIILMGECGCGKTKLLKYLCAFLLEGVRQQGKEMLVLGIHGGTSEADILNIFDEASSLRQDLDAKGLEESEKRVFV